MGWPGTVERTGSVEHIRRTLTTMAENLSTLSAQLKVASTTEIADMLGNPFRVSAWPISPKSIHAVPVEKMHIAVFNPDSDILVLGLRVGDTPVVDRSGGKYLLAMPFDRKHPNIHGRMEKVMREAGLNGSIDVEE